MPIHISSIPSLRKFGLKPPEFDIGINTVHLIYAQTVTWIGLYFSPLLSIVFVIILPLTFYLKQVRAKEKGYTEIGYGLSKSRFKIKYIFFHNFVVIFLQLSLFMNCNASSKPWAASQMQSVFYLITFLSYILAFTIGASCLFG